MSSCRATNENLLTAIRTAAEARWPGQLLSIDVDQVSSRLWVAAVTSGAWTRAIESGATEAEALERLLAEVTRA